MRLKTLAALVLALLASNTVFAQGAYSRGGSVNRDIERVRAPKGGSTRIQFLSKQDAERQLAEFAQPDTSAAMWIWADKYVYQAGQTLTLKWTTKPGTDVSPYTIVAYRVNNQTGAKTYVPNGTSTPTDIFGNTSEQGFRILRLPAAEKQTLLGQGGLLGAAVTIPNELGMHTLTVELRDYLGGRVLKTAYFKIGVVDEFVDAPNSISFDSTWVNTKAYRVSGLVYVRNNANLTIQPGTFVIGQPGSQPPSALIVTRSGRITASGTRSRPIIMTSSIPFGQRKAGDWGGLVLLGSAPTNWPTGEGLIEGLPDSPDNRYGGSDPAHNCGTLRYVRVEFAGAEFQPNNEVNAVTWGGCGTATVTEYVQTSYGFDDNFEWFAGNNNARYLVSTYARDDHFDGQIGWTGSVQFAVGLTNADNSNRGIELDNNETNFTLEPKSAPRFWNMTFVGAGDRFSTAVDEGTGVAGIFLRRGAAGSIRNIISFNWISNGIDVRDQATLDNVANNTLTINGLLLWDNGKVTNKPNTIAGQSSANINGWLNGTTGTASNVLLADPMLRRPFEFSDPDFRGKTGSPIYDPRWILPPDNGTLMQNAQFIGAFGEEDWTEEWTSFLQDQDLQ
ncbi:MAG: hypothetical protein U5J83_18360 [Bryobacterales bacterium]|nr:hypothetical protein [Bryobacterales bacterium]